MAWFLSRLTARAPSSRFLVYCACTYCFFPPYIKEVHLSIEVWHNNKGPDGWKTKCELYEEGPYLMVLTAEAEDKLYVQNDE
jgi:hypothetical protein